MEIKRDVNVWQLKEDLWSGAEDTLQIIIDNDKEEEFEQLYHEIFSDRVPDIVEVNDLLRFDWERVFECLGINEEEEEEEEND